MSASIKDVAKLAGVSTATVSRVINQYPFVSEETKEKVNQAINELNYYPDQGGRNLRKGTSKTILVLIPDIRNTFYSNILYGMDTVARQYEYNLIIASTYSDLARERNLIKLLRKKLADGIIFLASTLEEKELVDLHEQYPVVQCCEYNKGTSLTRISIDNYQAAYDAVEHLIKKGHKRIAFLSSNNDFLSTHLREFGYKQALQDYKIEIDEDLIVRGGYSFESGRKGTHIVMNSIAPPTAIFAISDLVASGAIQALYSLNLRTPQDVAVCGFDDIDMAQQLTPPLTTVAQPLELLGSMAVKTLIDKIQDREVKPEIILHHELMIRGSA